MATWGEITLRIAAGSYEPPHAEVTINEIDILPMAGIMTPATVIQGGGRKRKRSRCKLYVANMVEYSAFYDDYITQTEKAFTGPDGSIFVGLISDLGAPQMKMIGHVEFGFEIVEGGTT